MNPNDLIGLEITRTKNKNKIEDIYSYLLIQDLVKFPEYFATTTSSLRFHTLAVILNDIIINQRKSIIEFGSGVSTLAISNLIKKNNLKCSFVSIEDNKEWFDYINSFLSRNDLQKDVKNGRFREDLFYRLNVISITMIPLRERRKDISLLVRHFINVFNGVLNKNVSGCDEEAINILLDYDWPGNVRELRNVIERAMLLCNEHIISKEDLTPEVSNKKSEAEILDLKDKSLKEIIKLYSEQTLQKHNNNQTKAAESMNITRQRLRRILKQS